MFCFTTEPKGSPGAALCSTQNSFI